MAQYAEIVEIAAPDGATTRSRVDFTVKVKNLYSAPIAIMVGGILANAPGELTFPDGDWANVPAGETHTFPGYFTMPNTNAVLRIFSYWYDGEMYWYPDDMKEETVNLATPVPVFSELAVASFQKG